MLRGDSAKDDSGAYAVFTASASQMTAAKVIDVIARVHDFAGQAADAVSSYTQVKMEDAPRLFKNTNVRVSRYMDTSSTTQFAQIMVPTLKTLWFISIEICTVTRSLASCGKDDVRRFYWDLDGKKVLN